MPENKDKVEIELVASDSASATLERIQKQLEHLNKTHEEGPLGEKGKEGEGKEKEKFSWMEAFKIEAVKEGAEKLKEMFGEMTKAGAEQDRNARAITGILAMTDKTGQGYDSLLSKGFLFEEELHKTSIEAGVAQEKIVSAFDMIMERSGKSAEETNKITRSMAIASAAVPGGLEALSRGYVMMEQGMVRARNPIVQLIASTDTLHGGVQAVAKAMQTMTVDRRNALASEAIGKMAEKMEKAAPSFDSLMTSLHTFKEGVIEDIGNPILKVLAPKLGELLGILQHYEDKIVKGAREFGGFIAQEFEQIWDTMQKAFNDAEGSATNIKAMLKDSAQFLTDAFSGGVFLASKIASALGDSYHGLQVLLNESKDFIASIAPGGKVGYMAKYEQETAMNAANERGIGKLYKFGYTQLADEQIKKLMQESPEAANYFSTHSAQALGKTAQANTEADAKKYGFYNMFPGEGMNKDTPAGAVEQYMDDFQKAMQHAQADHNDAMIQYGAQIILGNDHFQEELVKAGDKTGIAWTQVLDNLKQLEGIIPDVTKEKVEHLEKLLRTGPGTAGSGPIFNINHMTIHQDFRDQDPERVAIVFQKDLAKAAINRTQAMMSGPFHP